MRSLNFQAQNKHFELKILKTYRTDKCTEKTVLLSNKEVFTKSFMGTEASDKQS